MKMSALPLFWGVETKAGVPFLDWFLVMDCSLLWQILLSRQKAD